MRDKAIGTFQERVGGLLRADLVLVALVVAGPALADEPKGCDGFKWPLKQEAALLQAPGRPVLQSGAAAKLDGAAFDLALVDFDKAALPNPPERTPKFQPSQAGFVLYDAPAAGAYQITISQGAWIDVVQDQHSLKPSAFTGATDCPGVRKSIRVTLASKPFTVQVSGTHGATIGMVVTPVP